MWNVWWMSRSWSRLVAYQSVDGADRVVGRVVFRSISRRNGGAFCGMDGDGSLVDFHCRVGSADGTYNFVLLFRSVLVFERMLCSIRTTYMLLDVFFCCTSAKDGTYILFMN